MATKPARTYTLKGGPEKGRIVKVPSMKTVQRWDWDGEHEALDGCSPVDPDGHCEHGYPSWMLKLGII